MQKRELTCAVVVSGLIYCASCHNKLPDSLNRPLSGFQQRITSPVKRFRMHSGQVIQLPILVDNTGRDVWVSRGIAPVLLSYVWSSNGVNLALEGQRTALPVSMAPGDSAPVAMRIAAPDRPGEYTLSITLVQEGVAWFLNEGGEALRLRVEVTGDDDYIHRSARLYAPLRRKIP